MKLFSMVIIFWALILNNGCQQSKTNKGSATGLLESRLSQKEKNVEVKLISAIYKLNDTRTEISIEVKVGQDLNRIDYEIQLNKGESVLDHLQIDNQVFSSRSWCNDKRWSLSSYDPKMYETVNCYIEIRSTQDVHSTPKILWVKKISFLTFQNTGNDEIEYSSFIYHGDEMAKIYFQFFSDQERTTIEEEVQTQLIRKNQLVERYNCNGEMYKSQIETINSVQNTVTFKPEETFEVKPRSIQVFLPDTDQVVTFALSSNSRLNGFFGVFSWGNSETNELSLKIDIAKVLWPTVFKVNPGKNKIYFRYFSDCRQKSEEVDDKNKELPICTADHVVSPVYESVIDVDYSTKVIEGVLRKDDFCPDKNEDEE